MIWIVLARSKDAVGKNSHSRSVCNYVRAVRMPILRCRSEQQPAFGRIPTFLRYAEAVSRRRDFADLVRFSTIQSKNETLHMKKRRVKYLYNEERLLINHRARTSSAANVNDRLPHTRCERPLTRRPENLSESEAYDRVAHPVPGSAGT